MKTKQIAITALTLVGIIMLSVSSSYAGAKQRHRWEGFAMGLGTAIIGQHILSHGHAAAPAYVFPIPAPEVHYPEPRVYHSGPECCPQPRRQHRRPKIVHHHYHGGHQKCFKKHHRRRPAKEVHHHYYGKQGRKHQKEIRHYYNGKKVPKHQRAKYHHQIY